MKHLAFSTVCLTLALPILAADPSAVLFYDFRSWDASTVHDAGTAGIDLLIQRRPNDGALEGPAEPFHPTKEETWRKAMNPNELSVAFWVRFDKLPSKGEPIGLVRCSADKDGILTVTLPAHPTQFHGDYELRSKRAVRKGEWVHVEFNYSLVQRKAGLYLDGRIQWENDNTNLPKLRLLPLGMSGDFSGAIRDFRVYDMSLPSEMLAIADDVPASAAAAKADTARARATAGNAPEFKKWLDAIDARADALVADAARTTIAQVKELRLDASNAAKIAADLAAGGDALAPVRRAPIAPYTVKPFSQEIFLPKHHPENGELSGHMRLVACRGEYEAASALVFAFRPLTIERVAISDFAGPGGAKIPASEVDAKLVKRWYRCGGAWLTYHRDPRQRNLTPDLLVNDDKLVRVDEFRLRNSLRLNYPEGTVYADVSDPALGHIHWDNSIPFEDAKTLQPVEIPEAGRNQQFLFTLHVPTNAVAGVYRGKVEFTVSGGARVPMAFEVSVPDIDLPTQGSPYDDLSCSYISHLNSFPQIMGETLEKRQAFAKEAMHQLRAHGLFHVTGMWRTRELAAIAHEEGLVPDRVFEVGEKPGDWRNLYPGTPARELSKADKEAAMKVVLHRWARVQRYLDRYVSPAAKDYYHYYSESGAWRALTLDQGEKAEAVHRLGHRVFAHGGWANLDFAGDIQDMQSSTSFGAEEGALWQAGRGELINYCNPFPSSENPEFFRRRIGMLMYKNHLHGHMMHGYAGVRIPWNEFAEDFGGDGSFRNFGMTYWQRDGLIYELCMGGYREAFDDVRYMTRLKQIALANADSDDVALRREARRQLLWLDRQNGDNADMDMVRLGCISRIELLQNLARARNGVVPPPDPPPMPPPTAAAKAVESLNR